MVMIVFFVLIANTVAISVQQLQSSVAQILANQPANEHWGVSASVFDASTLAFVPLLFANEEQFFQPASSNKLLATSLSYLVLGSNWTFSTSFTADTTDTLCIRASGDPSLTYGDLKQAVTQINASGGRQFKNLAVDKSFHRRIESYPDSWEMGDLAYDYGAAPTALVVNENVASFNVVAGARYGEKPVLQFDEPLESNVFQYENNIITVTTGVTKITQHCFPFQKGIVLNGQILVGDKVKIVAAVPMADQHFHQLLAAMLNINNLTLGCSSIPGPSLATIQSPPLFELLNHTLQLSDNLFAEAFFKTVTLHLAPLSNDPFSYADAVDVLRKHLPAAVSAGAYPVDGSGLSRHNLISPLAFRALFESMYQQWPQQSFAEYVSLLPVAGRSGTLSNRFRGTPAENILHAKTGTETGISSLSGVILRHNNAPIIVFSIIVNEASRLQSSVRVDIDKIAVLLAQLN